MTTSNRRAQVCVRGSADPGSAAYDLAGEAGALLATLGVTLVSGCGSQAARVSAERALAAGGLVVSIVTELGDVGTANDAATSNRPRRMLNISRGTGELLAVLVRVGLLAAIVSIAMTTTEPLRAQAVKDTKDIVYATVEGVSLALDLYLPAGRMPRGLVVWVHGGAWNTGTKASVPRQLIGSGLAVASVDFRQASQARFPAQIHDIKAAIRFLRAKARTYGYQADTIVIAGSSSGGHLAALVGVTNGHRQLEGSVGDVPSASSNVQGIVSYFGASNLRSILSQSTPFGLDMRRPALNRLLGAQPDQVPDLAQLASPVTHVDTSDPPLLLLHGDQDPQMPINQSHELQGAYEALGLPVDLRVLHGAAHGGEAFFAPRYLEVVTDFFARIGVT